MADKRSVSSAIPSSANAGDDRASSTLPGHDARVHTIGDNTSISIDLDEDIVRFAQSSAHDVRSSMGGRHRMESGGQSRLSETFLHQRSPTPGSPSGSFFTPSEYPLDRSDRSIGQVDLSTKGRSLNKTSTMLRQISAGRGVRRVKSDANLRTGFVAANVTLLEKSFVRRQTSTGNTLQRRMHQMSKLAAENTDPLHRWNMFRSPPRAEAAVDPRWTIIVTQAFKLFMYILIHVCVLLGALSCKMIVLLFLAQLRPQSDTYNPCRPYGMSSPSPMHRAGRNGTMTPQPPITRPSTHYVWFYWALWIAMSLPDALTFIRCLRNAMLKWVASPSTSTFVASFVIETARTIGYCLLVFVVLPQLDTVRVAMLGAALTVVPALLAVATNYQGASTVLDRFNLGLDVTAAVAQLSVLFVWPIFDAHLRSPAVFVVAVLLSSLHYWENYVTEHATLRPMAALGRLKQSMQESRYKIYLLLSVWKCLLSWFIMSMAMGSAHGVHTLLRLDNPFTAALTEKEIGQLPDADLDAFDFHYRKTVVFMVTLCLVTALCYHLARFALKVKMDWFSYVVPVMCVLPFSVVLSLVFCVAHANEPCYFAEYVPDSVFFNCNYGAYTWSGLVRDRLAWIYPLWLLSFFWLSAHVFTQKPHRLSSTDTLFVFPFYDTLFIEQSLTINRRRRYPCLTEQSDEKKRAEEAIDVESNTSPTTSSINNHDTAKDDLTKIYVCATMWHETRQEMKQMIKSIFRLDEDQCARRNSVLYFGVPDADYYEMEAHIFFDDAWETREGDGERVLNAYVKDMVGCMDDAASEVHGEVMQIMRPLLVDTPYGGRLMWTMPGDNRLYVHLKDKTKARHKKRWSQVMYMYYLLGYRIAENMSDEDRMQTLSDNTYILAIDGDSKFSPSAVQKLVDLMKKNIMMGAACGRIHPIGKGIMVWYQKFEYAIGHWFQKAAEHVFGCVLCSPGCFSLFRGAALMDDNVMRKYTKVATEPRHFVQYDQGEDRWLSTLLLKQGYRIEYAAASDAETYAPEGFDEFFNQRRRWTPSSVANTVDLLADYKRAVANNMSISRLYIVYQMMVILFSMLGPAIIFTMMIFAQVAAFNVDAWSTLWANAAPVSFFALVCFVASSEAQLVVAKVFSVAYAFVMMAVLVGTGIQIAAEGLASPTSLYILFIVGVFAGAALIHPRESANIMYGTVFFLMIPSTYVILTLYSLINLNVINWGTREAAQKASGKDVSSTVLERWTNKLRRLMGSKKGGGGGESFGTRLCQCFGWNNGDSQMRADAYRYQSERLARIDDRVAQLTGHPSVSGGSPVDMHLAAPTVSPTATSDRMKRRDQDLEGKAMPHDREACRTPTLPPPAVPCINVVAASPPPPDRHATPHNLYFTPQADTTQTKSCAIDSSPSPVRALSPLRRSASWSSPVAHRSDSTSSVAMGSAWMRDDWLCHGEVDVLDEQEHQFWSEFIDMYLRPFKRTPEEETEAVIGLRNLRNNVAFCILLVNGLLVVIIYLLQVHKDLLSFEYTPYHNYTWQKWFPSKGAYELVQEPLRIEPIGFIIILFLTLILVTQSVGMLLHRWHTLAHVLASTELTCFRKRSARRNAMDADGILNENAYEIAKRMQRLGTDDLRSSASSSARTTPEGPVGNIRKLVRDTKRAEKHPTTPGRLNAQFQRRLAHIANAVGKGDAADADRRSARVAAKNLKGVQFHNSSPFMNREAAGRAAVMAMKRRRESLAIVDQSVRDIRRPSIAPSSIVSTPFNKEKSMVLKGGPSVNV